LQKWTRVGCAIAELMREASHMFEVVNHAISDPAPQASLASLTVQHNTVLEQIDAAARGAARGGVDLLLGDTLALAFDETGASTLSMSGSVRNAAGLGLAAARGRNRRREGRRSQFGYAAGRARGATHPGADDFSASCDGQSRQKFFGNVLEMLSGRSSSVEATASEPASSLALSTRQAIATSALALAQESQTSILRLLNRSNFFGQGS
jgi:flagellin